MKQYYRKLSFLKKLTLINFSVGIPTVLIAILIGTSFIKNEGKKTINRQLKHISTLMAEMVDADILFNDGEAIENTLKNLSVFPTIKYACVVNNKEEIIATYGYNNTVNEEELKKRKQNYYIDDNAVVYQAIDYKQQKLGRLIFISNISPFILLINKIIFWLVITLSVLFIFWLLVSLNLQQFLIKPLVKLSETMDYVVKTEKYNIDVKYSSNEDEVGHLHNDFSQLMKTINKRTVSRNYLDNILDALAEMLIVLDENGEIKSINDVVQRNTGLKPDTLLHKSPDILIPNCCKDMKSNAVFETFIVTKYNTKIPVCISVTTFLNKYLKKRTVLSIRNIRERKINEAELEQYYQAIEEKNQELAVKNEELERFTYIASHDMKTPLRTITGFIGLIENRLNSSEKNNELLEYLTFVKNGAKQLNNLISDTLEFSKVKEQGIDYSMVNLAEMMDWIVKNFSETVNISVPDLPIINSNHSLLQKVFQNIIENGIKYNDSEIKKIEINYLENDNNYVFSIKDKGIGIDTAYYDKIFIMYKRLHNNEKYQGTGLGLAICKKIVEQLGGTLTLTSEVGVGTTFFIKLPKKSVVDKKCAK